MNRHSRHRRARGFRRGRLAAVLLVVGVTVGGGLVAEGRLAATAAGTSTLAGTATPAPAGAVRELRIGALGSGPVKGTLRLLTPVPADRHTWVTYVVEGPRTVVQVADAAPYELLLDTRTLPNGTYSVKQVVFHGEDAPTMTTGRMTVANAPSSPSTAAGVPGSAPTGATDPPGPSAPSAVSTAPLAPSTAPPFQSPQSALSPVLDVRLDVVVLTNAERAKAGCAPLGVDARLATAAQEHSADMAARDYFNHDSPDGHTAFDRITAAGYSFSAAAENIAAGQRTAADVVAGWMNSAGHRENILNCSLKQIGVGYATGGSYGFYWTQDFGSP